MPVSFMNVSYSGEIFSGTSVLRAVSSVKRLRMRRMGWDGRQGVRTG
jgi:hypothetical protein